ncbi:MAG: Eco57I restriction-modification methylase domain-containing protein [Fimbriimonas ginsengisoli]|uniref:site-specific DNA-methyltransferase (adenine-specific) n=1 Tax=Fimbriimonas ginsengisoli TaxID=1005039 RepID=A0A931LSI8_FIMGI|nr:Eco57I restriction-modification methylase domain-containing protein [Fimbriimonas ginsengisoli]
MKVPEEVFEALLGREGLFYSYNFTVEESSPLDVQVAVDPEILGRIFEQLTISGKRHDTGSYYTPRGIVQFMCREAVVAYLGGTGLREDKARAFVYDHSTEELTNKEGDRAFESLKVIKVVDPACGSGAYLLGMLQELYALFALLQRQDRKFSDDPAKEDHQRKLHIIENNIYGVDLQAFATNTAMLRLWLTLLVEDTGGKPQPLPNLEYKIETGDSLLGPDPSEPINWRRGAKGDQALLYDQSIHLTIDELRRLRSKYQDSHGGAKTQVKREYEPKLGELREKVTGAGVKDRAKFDWRVEFFDVFLDDPKKRTPGFDVVLANPPYISARHMAVDKGLLSQMYASAYGSYDIYVVFMERALQLLRSAGHMVFITSNKYLVADYGKKIREMLATSATILGIIDLADCRGVFSALVSPAITFARNASCSGSQTVRVARLSGSEWEQLSHSMLIAQQLSDLQDHFAAPILLSVDSKKRGLLQRLEKDATPLGELGNLRTGVMGFDYWNVEPFVHELHESPACDGPHHRRLLTNSQIAPYSLKFGMPIRLYKDSYTDPCIDLSSTTLSEETVAFFEAPKIALRGVARECTAAPDTEGCALLVAVHGIAQSRVDYDFLIALLNSALVNRLHRIQFYGARIPQGSLRYPISFWADVPVRSPDPEVVTALKSLMAKASPTDHGEAAKLRQALDTFLFDMYEVTPAEMME